MAKLDKPYPVMRYSDSNADFTRILSEQQKVLDDLQKESDKATFKNPVGFLMSFPIADGYAIYRVTKVSPLTLQHVPVFDAWRIPDAHLRGLTMEDVKEQIRFARMWEKLGKWKPE